LENPDLESQDSDYEPVESAKLNKPAIKWDEDENSVQVADVSMSKQDESIHEEAEEEVLS